jgi:hypothetical protein
MSKLMKKGGYELMININWYPLDDGSGRYTIEHGVIQFAVEVGRCVAQPACGKWEGK